MLRDAIQQFIASVDPATAKIISGPPFILVFGGPLSIAPEKKHISQRNLFLETLIEKNHRFKDWVRFPEHYGEWNRFEGYPDLLEFERDVGYLSRAVMIFCETSGALAELGMFAADDVLRFKTVAIVAHNYHPKISYISLGPLRRLEQIADESVCTVHGPKVEDFAPDVEMVIGALEARVDSAPKKEHFDPKLPRDQLLLVADLVDLFNVITKAELILLLAHYGVRLTEERLKQILNQLLLFQLLKEQRRGPAKYYVSRLAEPYVDHTALAGHDPFDRLRFKGTTFDLVVSEKQRYDAYQLAKFGAIRA